MLDRDPMLDLHDDVASLLESLPELADIYLVRSRTVDANAVTQIEDEIERALSGLQATASGKSGLAVIVMLPEIVLAEENRGTPGPACFNLELMLRIVENRLINEGSSGSKITATRCAAMLLQTLHHRTFKNGKALRANRNATEEDTIEGITYLNVRFTMTDGLPVADKVLNPTMTNSGGNITLACATSGAAIYYTTDGTLPTADNGTLYATPFTTPTAGTLIRVMATKTAHLPSNVSELQL